MAKFYTKEGWLTRYALACGYVHLTDLRGARVRMWCANAETPQYDVLVWKDGARSHWESFDTLHDARLFYALHVQRLFGALHYRFESNPDVARSVIL